MEHKGGQRYVHDAYIVRTAVCQKARLGTKRSRTVNIALAVIELCLPEGIRQAGRQAGRPAGWQASRQ